MLLNIPARRVRRVLVAGLTAISVALPASLASAGTLPEPEDPTVEEVTAIIDAAAPQVKLTNPILMDDGELVGVNSQGLVSLPSTSDGSVTVESLTETGGTFTVGLPELPTNTAAHVAKDGTVVYPSDGEVELAVQVHQQGVRMLTILESPEAPSRYNYPVDAGADATITVEPDGSATVRSKEGETVAVVQTPWAVDADGQMVATWFETDGQTLTQIVDHTTANHTYPITADPSWWDVTQCAAAITWVVVSTVFAVAKIAKIKKLINAAGGITKTASRVIKAFKTPGSIAQKAKAAFADLGTGVLAIASELLGVDTVIKKCKF